MINVLYEGFYKIYRCKSKFYPQTDIDTQLQNPRLLVGTFLTNRYF